MCHVETPVHDLLDLMERIRLAVPKLKRVWEFSAMARQGRDRAFEAVARQELEIRTWILSGRYTIDDFLRLTR